jgi:2-iminobutanoate/2-iminopropanoate deaminase
MQILNTKDAPEAVGPYSQATMPSEPGVPVFLSGQVGINPTNQKLEEGLKNQTYQLFANIKAVLKEADLTIHDVLFANVLLADINDFKEFNAYYEELFEGHKPARAAYAVKDLPVGAVVEVMVTAWKKV